jgi:2-polyprenyl-3-methyl-5-hydroxy-6-metoxy-1,4-benzoquinol methylase
MVYAGPQRLTREETWARYSSTYFFGEYLPSLGVADGKVDLATLDGRHRRTLAHIRPRRRLGALLEIGSGAGLFLKAADRDGWTVTGLELMTAGVEFARATLGLDVQEVAFEDANLPAAAYDVVALFEVIEHLSDPAGSLRRILSLLRPGGSVAISTPNISSLSHLALGRAWAVLSPAEHLSYFNETTLGALLRGAGYVNVRFDRQYACDGRYETMLPTHSHEPESRRTRAYTSLVNRLSPFLLRQVQRLGMADGLHCLADRPE